MPLLALAAAPTAQLVRPAAPPLVARRLVPPAEMQGDDWFRPSPIETPDGVVWSDRRRTRLSSGDVALAMARDHPAGDLRGRWWMGWTHDLKRTIAIDALTGAVREFPYLMNLDRGTVDEDGTPVDVHRGASSGPRRPRRGDVLLKTPPEFDVRNGRSELRAAPRGRLLAGTLWIAVGGEELRRPYLWRRDDAPPTALPLPAGFDEGDVSSVNARGDVTGLVMRERRPGVGEWIWRAALWPAGGGVRILPVGSSHSDDRIRDDGDRGRWQPYSPEFVTEEGLVVGREDAYREGKIIRTLWDGRRTMWILDAIEGVPKTGLFEFDLAYDGRSILVRTWDGSTPVWYLASPRSAPRS